MDQKCFEKQTAFIPETGRACPDSWSEERVKNGNIQDLESGQKANLIEHKLTVLSRVAELLDQTAVTWAVGASLLLYLKGITDHFNDIDIMVIEEDVPAVEAALSAIGTLSPPNPNTQYKTKHFLEFVIDDVDIDVMAGFVIVDHGTEHLCPLVTQDIVERITIHGSEIPLHSVTVWREYYRLMHRDSKVEMIDRFLL